MQSGLLQKLYERLDEQGLSLTDERIAEVFPDPTLAAYVRGMRKSFLSEYMEWKRSPNLAVEIAEDSDDRIAEMIADIDFITYVTRGREQFLTQYADWKRMQPQSSESFDSTTLTQNPL